MINNSITFIGLDTHKDFFEVAYIEDNREAKPVSPGRINGTKPASQKLVRQFESKYPGATLHFVYEAGSCGYRIYRFLTSLGHCCYVVAPSLIPKKAGERVKTDKRDALKLALLLRNNIRGEVQDNWSAKHLRWLTELILLHPSQQIVLQEAIQTITGRIRRLERLDNELSYHVKNWRYYPVVKAIQAMRGVRLLVAVGVIAELGDLSRFDHPRKLGSHTNVWLRGGL